MKTRVISPTSVGGSFSFSLRARAVSRLSSREAKEYLTGLRRLKLKNPKLKVVGVGGGAQPHRYYAGVETIS